MRLVGSGWSTGDLKKYQKKLMRMSLPKKLIIIIAVIFIIGAVFFNINKSLTDKTKTDKESISTYQNQQIVPLDFFRENHPKKEFGFIWTDLVSDEEGRVHLVWTSRGSGIFYTVNEPHGLKWKQPVSLPIDASQEDVSAPRLVFSNNQLFLFYGSHLLCLAGTVSENREVSWKEMPPLLKSGPYGYEYGEFDVVSGPGGIVIGVVRRDDSNEGKTTLDVLVSSPDGQNFDRKTIFDGQITGDHPVAKPSLVIDGSDIYVLWVNTEKITTQSAQGVISIDFVSSMYYFHSGDFGKTWNQEKLSIDNASPKSMITHSVLLHDKEKLFAVFTDGYGTYMETKGKNDFKWSGQTRLMNRTAGSLMGVSGSEPRILWTDKRFTKMEWWGDTPLQIFAPDTSPYWINNDVFMLNLEQPSAEPFRLTPSLSSTDAFRAITLDDKSLFMFRFGCAEVYKKNSCTAKEDLFIHKIEIGDGGNF